MERKYKTTIDTGSDFSGIGAFDQALERNGIQQNKIFACDMDKFARQTYVLNYGEPKYFPKNVYDRIIPEKSLGLYMATPPCQGFSMSGKREGSILFLNSHEFIQKNKPRYFILENVKGLLSHEKNKNDKSLIYGKTFSQWLNYLGGKSVNGNPVMFPDENSVPYHIYFKVMNAKEYGVPQNRERVFIVGIRDDSDNNFQWPKVETLKKKIKDLIEKDVPEKYYLKQNIIDNLTFVSKSKSIQNKDFKAIKFNDKIPIKSNTKKGYDLAKEGDTVNFAFYKNEEKRGRVGKGICQTLDTLCTQSVVVPKRNNEKGLTLRRLTPLECFRIMGFNENFKFETTDSQAYKQAGNSIAVGVLEKIISKLQF